jgi:hypothetical protein
MANPHSDGEGVEGLLSRDPRSWFLWVGIGTIAINLCALIMHERLTEDALQKMLQTQRSEVRKKTGYDRDKTEAYMKKLERRMRNDGEFQQAAERDRRFKLLFLVLGVLTMVAAASYDSFPEATVSFGLLLVLGTLILNIYYKQFNQYLVPDQA